MKNLILYFIVLICSVLQAQEVHEALRYAQENLSGTARFSAMSGAFGALGGDLSSLNANPAGSAIFLNNQAGATLSRYNTKNKATYFENSMLTKTNSVDLNQAGAVFVFKNTDSKSDWKKFSLAINYENTNNFDNSMFSKGKNPNNSVAKYFLSYANPNTNIIQGGFYLDNVKNYYYEEFNFQDQQAYLGITGNVIKPNLIVDDNDSYSSNSVGGNYKHENSIESSGYNGKISFNASTAYKDKLMIGINFNSHFTDFRQSTKFIEINEYNNENNNANGIQNATFYNDLYTYGSGFSFQLGTIYKATKELRLGISYESPTWYILNDQLNQKLYTKGLNFINYNINGIDNYPIINGQSSTSSDSDMTILYAPYKLQTPSKWTGSLAYVFDKKGLLSIDYAVKDYGNTQFKPENEFSNPNTSMANLLNQSGELRIGGEYKIKQWSLRAGYRFEESPYKNKTTLGDLKGYSGGLGYNFGSTKLDFSYSTSKRNAYQGFFSQGFKDGATTNTINNNLSLTLLFEL